MAKKSKEDPAMVKVRSLFKVSGLSLFRLGKQMGYADEIARQAAWQFMQSRDPRLSMLRKFAEAMEIPLDHLTPKAKGRKMIRKLEDELSDFDCKMDAGTFRELIEERKAVTSPSWTIDELVCHPEEAKSYCQSIREATECQSLPDHLILRTLMNVRRSH
jgi:transcriptional regulator with XRE-family HTH domain